MDFVISVLQHSVNLPVTSIIENKSFVNVIIIKWLATPFVKLTISISERSVSFKTSEVEATKSWGVFSSLFQTFCSISSVTAIGIIFSTISKHS